jgi:ABC-2 type transport system permease protein
VDAGDVDAAIVIPAGFSDAIQAGEPARLLVIGGPSTLSTEIARTVLAGFGSEVTAVQVGVRAVLGATGADPEPSYLARLAQDALAIPAPVVVSEGKTADRQASSTTYYGASMAVLFVFFAAQFGVVGLLAERRTGTLARLLASPVSPSAILFGKVLVSLVLAAVSMSVMVVATTFLLGASWGDPVAVVALVLSMSIAATGIATLVVGFARTEEQAGGAIAIVALTLAVLGGSFFPLSQAPEGLAALSLITPHAWFIRGINDLAADGGIGTVAGSILVLLAVGAVSGGIGLARARRVVTP